MVRQQRRPTGAPTAMSEANLTRLPRQLPIIGDLISHRWCRVVQEAQAGRRPTTKAHRRGGFQLPLGFTLMSAKVSG